MPPIVLRTFDRLLPVLAAAFIFAFPFTIQAQAQETPGVGTESFSIPDRGGQSAAPSGEAEAVRTGYGRIRADAGSTTPSGIAIFQFRDSQGVLISEAGVPATEPVLEGRIFAEVDGPVNTGLAIANPNDETATIDFYFTDTDGTSFSDGTVQLDAHQQTAKFLDQPPFNSGSPVRGTFTFESSVPIAVIAIRGFTNEAGEFLMTTLPVAPLSSASEETVYIPHFAAGGGWVTQVILVNPTDSTITGTVGFLGPGSDTAAASPVILTLEDGSTGSNFDYSIPPRSSQRFTTSNPFGALNSGSVRATPNSGNAAPSGLVIFSYAPAGKTLSESGVPALPKGSAFRVYVEASQVGSINTGLAITNTASTSNTVTLEVTGLDGSLAVAPATLELPPSGQVARFLNEFFSLPDNFFGVLRVTSTADVAIVALRLRVNANGEIKVTTLAPSNEREPSTSEDRFFPHLADSGGWSTQFILFSGTAGQASSGTLSFFDPFGEPLYLIPPGGGDRFYLGQVRLSCGECGTFEGVDVVLTGTGVLETVTPNTYGQFGFFGLGSGDYTIQVRKPGYRSSPARSFSVEGDGRSRPRTTSSFSSRSTRTCSYSTGRKTKAPLDMSMRPTSTNPSRLSFLTRKSRGPTARLLTNCSTTTTSRWSMTETMPGRTSMPTACGRRWNRFLRETKFVRRTVVAPSQWIIVSEHVADDIRIDTDTDGSRTVSISVDAFVYATPRIARIEGKRGAYYSKRLHMRWCGSSRTTATMRMRTRRSSRNDSG